MFGFLTVVCKVGDCIKQPPPNLPTRKFSLSVDVPRDVMPTDYVSVCATLAGLTERTTVCHTDGAMCAALTCVAHAAVFVGWHCLSDCLARSTTTLGLTETPYSKPAATLSQPYVTRCYVMVLPVHRA